MPLPNFIISGAPKSGTSSLWRYVRQHPDVFMPENKEIAYFDYKYDRGKEWYKKRLESNGEESTIGEATPWYMCDDKSNLATRRMAKEIPNAKILFILRDPVYRARSNFWDDFRNADGPINFNTKFSKFIRKKYNEQHTIIKCGMYFEHIRRFEKHFDREQILVIMSENLKNKPVNTVQRVYKFLNVDPSFVPDTSTKARVTNGFRHIDTLRKADRVFHPIESFFGGTPLTWLWNRIPHFRYLFWREGTSPPSMSSDDREYLQDLYAESNEKLSTHLDLDLSHWEGMNE